MKRLLLGVALIGGLLLGAVPQASAANLIDPVCKNTGGAGAICAPDQKNTDATAVVKKVLDTLFVVLGILAVIMIVAGGFRYVLSGGDKSAILMAKNTIFYAVIGLVIAILAFTIVQFVLKKVS